MNQVLITAAFMFLFHFPSTLMAEFKVESDKENVVSSRLEGRWQFNEAISTRLSTRLSRNRDRAVEFHADDKVVAKIPRKYKKFLADKNAVSIGAFHASIAFAAGMEIEKPAMSPSGRPMSVGDGEKPILELFA